MVSTGLIRDYIVNEEVRAHTRSNSRRDFTVRIQTFDQSLFNLLQAGMISMDEALRNASNADEFRMRMAGILSSEQAIEGSSGMPRIQAINPSPADERSLIVKH